MKTGDYVEIMEAKGPGNWKWTKRYGHVVEVGRYSASVRADDGELVRDVLDHFRVKQ